MTENERTTGSEASASRRKLCPDRMAYLENMIMAGHPDDFESSRAVMMAECTSDCGGKRRVQYGHGSIGALALKLNIGKDTCGRNPDIVLPQQILHDRPSLFEASKINLE